MFKNWFYSKQSDESKYPGWEQVPRKRFLAGLPMQDKGQLKA